MFIDNPGRAYDPAPLEEFTDEEDFLPMVGDIIRWDETSEAYEVTTRFFDYSSSQCALKVVKARQEWPM